MKGKTTQRRERTTSRKRGVDKLKETQLVGLKEGKYSDHTKKDKYFHFKSQLDKLNAVRAGINASNVSYIIKLTGRNQSSVAKMFSLTGPTLRKYLKAGTQLDPSRSEHAIELVELYEKGTDTFGSLDEFKKWLDTHNIGLNEKPSSLLDSITGIKIVENLLLRIDYGALA